MHALLTVLLLLAATLRRAHPWRTITTLTLITLALRGTNPSQRPRILAALSPALTAVSHVPQGHSARCETLRHSK